MKEIKKELFDKMSYDVSNGFSKKELKDLFEGELVG